METTEASFEESTSTTAAESAYLSPLDTTIDLLAAGNGSPGSEEAAAQTTEPPSSGSSAPEEDRILWLIVGALVAVAVLVALVTWRYWLLTRPGLDLGEDGESDGYDHDPEPAMPPARSAMPAPVPPGPVGHTVFDDPNATQPYTPPDVFPGPAVPEPPQMPGERSAAVPSPGPPPSAPPLPAQGPPGQPGGGPAGPGQRSAPGRHRSPAPPEMPEAPAGGPPPPPPPRRAPSQGDNPPPGRGPRSGGRRPGGRRGGEDGSGGRRGRRGDPFWDS